MSEQLQQDNADQALPTTKQPVAVTVSPEQITDGHFLLGRFEKEGEEGEHSGALAEVTVIEGTTVPDATEQDAYQLLAGRLPIKAYLTQMNIGQGRFSSDVEHGVELRFDEAGEFYNWRSASRAPGGTKSSPATDGSSTSSEKPKGKGGGKKQTPGDETKPAA